MVPEDEMGWQRLGEGPEVLVAGGWGKSCFLSWVVVTQVCPLCAIHHTWAFPACKE